MSGPVAEEGYYTALLTRKRSKVGILRKFARGKYHNGHSVGMKLTGTANRAAASSARAVTP
jgi:hypothetical protein